MKSKLSYIFSQLRNPTGSFFKLKKYPDGSIGCFSVPEKSPDGSIGCFSMPGKCPDESKGSFSMLEKSPDESKGFFLYRKNPLTDQNGVFLCWKNALTIQKGVFLCWKNALTVCIYANMRGKRQNSLKRSQETLFPINLTRRFCGIKRGIYGNKRLVTDKQIRTTVNGKKMGQLSDRTKSKRVERIRRFKKRIL